MKKLLLLPFLALFAIVACKDDSSPNDEQLTLEQIKELPYSKLSPEQQKEKLQTEASTFLDEIKGLSSLKAIDVIENFTRLCDQSTPEVGNFSDEADIIYMVDVYGIFTWNKSSGLWDKANSSTQLEFVFPALKNGTSNNAKITINGEASTISMGDGKPKVQMPKKLIATITADGAQMAKIDVSSEWISNNTAPSKASIITTLDAYTLNFSAERKDNVNTATGTFKKGEKLLLDITATLNANLNNDFDNIAEEDITTGNTMIHILDKLIIAGDVDYAAIENGITEINKNAPKYPNKEDFGAPEEPNCDSEINGDACDLAWQAYRTVYNAWVASSQGIAFQQACDKWEADYDIWSSQTKIQERITKEAQLYTKYTALYLVSASDKTKIAKLGFRGEVSSYTYCARFEYGTCLEEVIDYDGDVLNTLIFNDNTEIDMDVYFGKGFDTIKNKWEEFINAFER